MKLLITNDDSISSEILLPLAGWAKQFGEVTVIVPRYEQSGKSHCVEFRKPFEVKQVPFGDPAIKAYTVDSTPADCVRFAMEGMQASFDFVISGINRGFNLGMDVLYSGTLGAIFEAASFGIPAVALSAASRGFGAAMESLDEIRDYFVRHELLKNSRLYNVNIPFDPKGIRITRMGSRYHVDEFLPQGNDLYLPSYRETWTDSGVYDIDFDAALAGYISVTPLTLDRTDTGAYEKLRGRSI